jgi:hypothetical protein
LFRQSDIYAREGVDLERSTLAKWVGDSSKLLAPLAASRSTTTPQKEPCAITIGRRNYLFAGSDGGGERAAAIDSLVGSAKLNGMDPEAYLRYVLERIADHPIKHIEELPPWNVATNLSKNLRLAA